MAAIGIVAVMAFSTSGCAVSITWVRDQTHGILTELNQARASLVIYEVYTDALWAAFDASNNISTVAELIWAHGLPPLVSVCADTPFGRLCYTESEFIVFLHQALFVDNIDDLRQAMYDSHDADDCLAFTFVSRLRLERNWTHKQTGCRGSGNGEPTAPIEEDPLHPIEVDPPDPVGATTDVPLPAWATE